MKINSPAGNFIITFEKLEPVDGNIQITGKFGAWDAKAQMSLSEFFGILRMAMTMKMIGFFAQALIRRKPK
jgi:hypothetical protein|tara:strand:+ start:2831 stop:3043 length:213 start_codon:yes stop_codon:yes gene_type:complete